MSEHIRCIPLSGLPVQVNTFSAFLCLDCWYRRTHSVHSSVWIAGTGEHIQCIPLSGLLVQVNTFGAFLCLDCQYR